MPSQQLIINNRLNVSAEDKAFVLENSNIAPAIEWKNDYRDIWSEYDKTGIEIIKTEMEIKYPERVDLIYEIFIPESCHIKYQEQRSRYSWVRRISHSNHIVFQNPVITQDPMNRFEILDQDNKPVPFKVIGGFVMDPDRLIKLLLQVQI